jgi:hypothetical protein
VFRPALTRRPASNHPRTGFNHIDMWPNRNKTRRIIRINPRSSPPPCEGIVAPAIAIAAAHQDNKQDHDKD